MTAPCQCPEPGFCKRHGFTKTAHLHHLCQTRDDYRTLWDRRARPPALDSLLVIRRIAICHRCHDRPEGCWRAVAYGCMIEYHNAGRLAAEKGTCPLGKL